MPKPKNKIQKNSKSSYQGKDLMVASQEIHSGPLPSPENLKKYDDLIPNGADRIMKMAEKEQEHGHSINKSVIEIDKSNLKKEYQLKKRGQYLGFIIALIGLGCGTYLAAIGDSGVGGTIVGGTIVSIVLAYIYGRKKNQK